MIYVEMSTETFPMFSSSEKSYQVDLTPLLVLQRLTRRIWLSFRIVSSSERSNRVDRTPLLLLPLNTWNQSIANISYFSLPEDSYQVYATQLMLVLVLLKSHAIGSKPIDHMAAHCSVNPFSVGRRLAS
jgi:hypothetical protein